MTVRLSTAGAILLEGACPDEDAEALLEYLAAYPAAQVDWRACEAAHTAVIQVLMASGAQLLGPPRGQALRDWVVPALTRPSARAT
jgi:hypothetical protein